MYFIVPLLSQTFLRMFFGNIKHVKHVVYYNDPPLPCWLDGWTVLRLAL